MSKIFFKARKDMFSMAEMKLKRGTFSLSCSYAKVLPPKSILLTSQMKFLLSIFSGIFFLPQKFLWIHSRDCFYSTDWVLASATKFTYNLFKHHKHSA